ncbi:tubulin/FtsZ family protein [Halovenus rubra]|uniref:Tubulin/FtsZ family protein n=2 Tax=Halovenus rubra TaxID=869890 RepID=A0ACC7E4Y3_9EURY|nr:tubulin/FtsZ family protein [Halovenus rubra]
MKFALVGVGGAGGRIVDRLHEEEAATGRSFSNGSLLAFDTDRSAFEGMDHIPLDRHILVGDTHPDIRGEGVDGDIELAVSVAREDRNELHREFDKLKLHELDAVVLVGGLAGGTGGGLGAVILESLQTLTDIPVYAIGVLPDGGEPDQHIVNAAESLQSFVRLADSVILFDNDAWHDSADTLETAYDSLNDGLAQRVSAMLGLNELADADIAENTLDSSDLIKTLDSGGISVIGQATVELEDSGFFDRIVSLFRNGDETEDDGTTTTLAMRTQDLVQEATTRNLTTPCEMSSTDRGLLLVSGPAEEISRKGFESGRYWLEQESDAAEVFAGDEPRPNGSTVTASVLLSNVTEIPRVDRLKERAVEAKQTSTSKHQPQD